MTQLTKEFSARTRQGSLQRLKSQQFDVLIVGGGITGAGIVRDATMRGYKTALIDKGDFASGTSSKSSRLIHGGVRYLEQFEFGLVFEASRERRVLWQIAPHLALPLPFIFPVYKDATILRRFPFMIDVGLWMYDGLALFRNYKNHRMYSPKQIGEMMRGFHIDEIGGGALYYDGQVDDARLTLETIRTGHRYGAEIANYVQVDELLKHEGRIVGVKAHDVLNGEQLEIRARVVVNSTGPWSDTLSQLDDPSVPKRMRPTKGVHVVLPREKIGGDSAVAFTVPDGRLMFTIPWDKFTVVGTTDTDYDADYDRVYADVADVDYIIKAANHAFPGSQISKSDVISTWAGLRPLVSQLGKSTSGTSREHEIWTTESGLVSIAGGKLTTYRSMAEQLVDVVVKELSDKHSIAPKSACMTARVPLVDVEPVPMSDGLPQDVQEHLIHSHGPEAGRVTDLIKRDAKLGQRIVEDLPYIWAEVPYAIENEMAMTVTDVLERRMHMLTEARDLGIGAAPQVAQRLGAFLDLGKAQEDENLRVFQDKVDQTSAFKKS
jgi:glycerol-3-phosphate dehydrogenase